jgi:endonuclease IV
MIFIGAHIPKDAFGILASLEKWRAHTNCFQLFLGSNIGRVTDRMYKKMLDEAADVKQFLKDHEMKLYIHLPYTVNMANEDVQDIIRELEIAGLCGAMGCVLHVGKHVKKTVAEGEALMLANFKACIKQMKEKKIKTKIFIETAAGQGTELIVSPKAFNAFIAKFNKEEMQYIGTCLDTAHVWAAGWNLETSLEIVSPDLVHFNNSKVRHGSRVDRHANLEDGMIPVSILQQMAKDCAKRDIPMILETPLCTEDVPVLVKWAGGST